MSDHGSDETVGPDGSSPRDADATLSPASSELAGDQIGHYRLLEPLGEGGFGTVWAAEQREPVKRRVALKIIKLGMDTKQVIARFEAERQALAMMDHPNIARVFDAGSTDTGRPFFVMELVRGVPIIEYCDREKLDTKARLDLFTKVCHAIQHAHQKGIIHRDIKPSNVLVTLHDGKPVPKVIDFGIAKATNQELTDKTVYTQHRQMIGTPAYMSPEQAEMSGLDIDTRSDVYSLGVLLYEMLTGTTPFSNEELNSAGLEGMMRMIRDVEPHKPSTRLSSLGETGTRTAQRRRAPDVKRLGLILRGDLDWIVMKCLEKDRTRRYDTANGLAEDIERHLNDEPVSASPPSTGYRLRKFVKRNRGQVAAGTAIVALLVVGIIGTSWGMAWAIDEKTRADEQAALATIAAESERLAKLEAEESAQRAIEEARRAEAAEAEASERAEELQLVADFQAEQLGAIEPQVMGINIRRSLLDAVPEEDREAFEDAMGPINFTNLALATLEQNIFERTIETIEDQFADQPLVRAQLLQSVAETLVPLGLFDLAVGPQESALRIRHDELGAEHVETIDSMRSLAILQSNRGKVLDAVQTAQTAVEVARRALGDKHPDTLASISILGFCEALLGRRAEAETHLREALVGYREALDSGHPDTLTTLFRLGFWLDRWGEPDEAEAYLREALEGRRAALGERDSLTLDVMVQLGSLLRDQRKLDEAEEHIRNAVDGMGRALGDGHPQTSAAKAALRELLTEQGRLQSAEILQREILDEYRRSLGDGHPFTVTALSQLGKVLLDQGKFAEAEPVYREVVARGRQVLGEDHEQTLVYRMRLFEVIWKQSKWAESEPLVREIIEVLKSEGDAGREDAVIFQQLHAQTLVELDRPSEALVVVDEALASATRVLGERASRIGSLLYIRARAFRSMSRYAEAATAGREAYAILRESAGEEHGHTRNAALLLAGLYDQWHETEPDAGHDAIAAEWRAKLAEAQTPDG